MNAIGLNVVIYTILGVFVTLDAQFINPPPNEEVECTGNTVYFNWTYSTSSPVFAVEWKVNGTSMANEIVQANQPFTPSGSYASRLTKVSNAQVSLASVNPNDYGDYTCDVSYTSGLGYPSNPITLFVYDIINGSLSISKAVKGNSVTLSSSITDQDTSFEWTHAGKVVGSESTYRATKNGKYTLTLGKRGKCLSPGPSFASVDVDELAACTGAFECGFCPILIVVVSSVIICILMWKEVPKRIGGFSTVKIVVIVIFSVVAIGIGLGLGLGLREGQENCLNCGATIGISISLGVALSVMQFAIIFNCNNEKGCKDSKGVTSDRSNGDRARTPTSASGVTMEAKKKSLNKPTEKGTEVSSLNTKPVGHPLPETPNGRKNQLEPISVEVDNSAREKKKKKKKKEKKEKKEASEELQF